ncbi:pilus assembly PilX N-terminal domain-containing protein [Nocardioides sp. YIM 152315]|uniref:pilus assembly PilX N-terminal domain-containing protein n=1 Tax=Nocardioides sp. YIM 152315 TaxID=3031760 RepID=UPI0023DB70EF|nr:pilus assembly PilX N-terminal domain-containing protein [Nocardioides sp. YIM 152315]MDF1603496.1 pilus assembly PilX N-terminal domain-containing protein [Nocardioides sp. YIM 152315]
MRRRDEGSALILVLCGMTIAMVVVTVALTGSLQVSGQAKRATAWYQALAAAEAGVDDYLARLNDDDDGFQYWAITPNDDYRPRAADDDAWDCENLALQRPLTGSSPPCGWGPSTSVGWLPVRSETPGEFHYDADLSTTPADGTVRLVSTGRVRESTDDYITRSVSVTLRRDGFGEFLYHTMYETKDPADYVSGIDGMSPGQAADRCTRYYWRGPADSGVRNSDCVDINFVGGDVLDGPVHSNDTMLMLNRNGTGPRFKDKVTTSDPACRNRTSQSACYRRKPNTAATPQFDKDIAYREVLDLPASIGDLKQYVDPAQTDLAGCLYTGPTRIRFNASPSGTMTVWSPYSRLSTLNPGCAGDYVSEGSAPSDTGTWPRRVAVPQNNLIMVQNVPATHPLQPPSGSCAARSIGGFPHADDYNQTLTESSCRYGTVYVDGTLQGRVTISAEHNVVITGSLLYRSGKTGTDVLGLIASNSVQIYHPISKGQCTQYDGHWERRYGDWVWVRDECVAWARGSNNLTGSVSSPTIHASILTLQHSFEVQQYDVGSSLGTIHLFGSIAQRFRGPVGTSNSSGGAVSGYLKDYQYDTRLRFSPPPFFLDPVGSRWNQQRFSEIDAQYVAD